MVCLFIGIKNHGILDLEEASETICCNVSAKVGDILSAASQTRDYSASLTYLQG